MVTSRIFKLMRSAGAFVSGLTIILIPFWIAVFILTIVLFLLYSGAVCADRMLEKLFGNNEG